MKRQLVNIVLVIIALGVAVGLAIGVSSNNFNALEQTSVTNTSDPEAQAAEKVLAQFPQIIGQIALEQSASGTLSQATSSGIKNWLAPKASAQDDHVGACNTALEEKIIDQAMAKLRAAFEAELAALRKQGLSIKDPCFTIKGEVTIDATLYHSYPVGSTDPYGYQVAVTITGVLKLFYYDENCQYKEVIKRFPKKTHNFKWVKPGKIESIGAIGTSTYEVCASGIHLVYDEPMGECPRCKKTAVPTETQQ